MPPSELLKLSRITGTVSQKIFLCGFDDLRLSGFLTPPLTTVRAPTEEVGRIAARAIVWLIDEQHLSGMTVLPTEIDHPQVMWLS